MKASLKSDIEPSSPLALPPTGEDTLSTVVLQVGEGSGERLIAAWPTPLSPPDNCRSPPEISGLLVRVLQCWSIKGSGQKVEF
jgi:hypothetical protein